MTRLRYLPLIAVLCGFQAQALADEGTGARRDVVTTEALSGPVVEYHFIDVGQGDAVLVLNKSDGKAFVVDCGPKGSDRVIVPYLRSVGVESLEALIITHSHADHMGALVGLIQKVPVAKIYFSSKLHSTATNNKALAQIKNSNIPVEFINSPSELKFMPGLSIQVLHPPKGWNIDNGTEVNDTSIVLRISFGDIDVLLMGDAEHDSEAEIAESGRALESEVIKLGHHGSHTASGLAFLKAVDPVVAVVFCAEGNRYGHPHDETLDTIRLLRVILFRTDKHGNVIIRTDGRRIQIPAGGETRRRGLSPVVAVLVPGDVLNRVGDRCPMASSAV